MASKNLITSLSIPRTKERGPIEVGFRYQRDAQGFDAVAAAIETPIGTLRSAWPAAQLGIDGDEGAGRLTLDLRGLPVGTFRLWLQPVLEGDQPGEGTSGELLVPGADGATDGLVHAVVVDAQLRRPHGADLVFLRADLAGEPGPDGVAAVWAWLRGPGGTEWTSVSAWPVAGEEDTQPQMPPLREARQARVTLASIGADAAAGAYEAAIHLVDAAGRISAPALVQFELVERGGVPGPQVTGFKPARAAAGDEVVVRGEGFVADEGEELRVEVGGVLAGVLHAEGKLLRIRMPELADPGRLVVAGGRGIGRSEGWLTPRAQVRLVPEVLEVAEGATARLTAVVQGSESGKVRFALSSRSKRPGSISADGVYTPPTGGLDDEVVITATHAGDEAATALVRVVAQAPMRGPLRIGPMGGAVRSQDDGCALTFPAGALARLRSLAIEEDPLADGDAPVGGLVVGQVRIEGAPRELQKPAEMTMRLKHALLPGQRVNLRWRDSPKGPWRDWTGQFEVIPGSEALKIRVDRLHPHWQGWIDFDPSPPTWEPRITSVEPSAIDEGATAALWIKGSHFVPGVTRITVHRDSGQLEPRVVARQVHVVADGTQLGVTVKAGVMTELPEGDMARLRLHITTPAGTASVRLDVLGHDELELAPGAAVSLQQSRMFSRVNVAPGATLRLAHREEGIVVGAHETFTVGAASGRATVEVLTGNGSRGMLGTELAVTPPAIGPGLGGIGGLAPGAGGGSSGGAGGNGGLVGGMAGRRGDAGGRGFMSAGGAGGAGGAAAPVLGNAGDGARGSTPGFTGPTEFIDIGSGSGGGGGGGGGGEGVVFTSVGGGGGGGGAGGGALRLAAGEEVRIVGRIQANGGDGGPGAFPMPVGVPPAAPLLHAGCGGGGGAGAGGGVGVHGVRLLVGEMLAANGTRGANARFADAVVTSPDTRTPLQRLLANGSSGVAHFDGTAGTLSATILPAPTSLPDLDYRADLVSAQPQVTMGGFGSGQLMVTDAQGVRRFIPAAGQPFSVSVPLSPGFNLVEGVAPFANSGFLVGVQRVRNHPLRARRVLYLPGTAPVFTFNCTITPAAPVVATERSVAFAATVSGSPQAALTWEVDGGTANGDISAAGLYRAPCEVPASGAATVRARSAFDPNRTAAVNVTVLPGIEVGATAASGTPRVAGQPSANVGQAITVRIPAATLPVASERFVPAQNVVFETHSRDASTGTCIDGTTTMAGTVATGLAQMTVQVPRCAAPGQHLRVPGHGCARLQIVPRILSLNRGTELGDNMGINGDGFVCGQTEVLFGGTPVPVAQLLSVSCDVILVGVRPTGGQAVTVRTPGGTSNAMS